MYEWQILARGSITAAVPPIMFSSMLFVSIGAGRTLRSAQEHKCVPPGMSSELSLTDVVLWAFRSEDRMLFFLLSALPNAELE